MEPDDRRKFPRINIPLYFRPARRRLPRRQVVDMSLGGARVYSDEPLVLGARFEIELFLPDNTSVDCLTEVVWVRPIEGGRQGRRDGGLAAARQARHEHVHGHTVWPTAKLKHVAILPLGAYAG